ncbi:bidirectional sugar transporter SWEET17 [Cryptomeria japonica]|uniref:bidirectional sugar transporter SWEET17 n=1 Tax=Cryptomeria japonica TaxID=3369 RepID=UPI0027DAA409|nr:bidirectional sugar transporter SWEET17 [Cryptomeria japonica]
MLLTLSSHLLRCSYPCFLPLFNILFTASHCNNNFLISPTSLQGVSGCSFLKFCDMASVSFVLGVIGNVTSILAFISPVKTFWRIIKNKSTEDFKSLPYVCTLLSTSLWTYYGLMKPNGLLIWTVNGAGVLLEAIYVSLFILYAPKRTRRRTIVLVLLVDIAFFTAVFLVTFLALNKKARIDVIGVLCICLTLSMYGSPLSIMRTVIIHKSVEFMPFFLTFFLFLNGGVWGVWAFFEKDVFVGIPNGIGFGLGAAQLVLYMIYRNGKPYSQENANMNGVKHVEDIEMGSTDRRNAVENGF